MKKITYFFLIFFLQFSYANLKAQTFIVNTATDVPVLSDDVAPGDGACLDGNNMCSLRAAIMEANALMGHQVINFNIQPLGLIKIQPTTAPGAIIAGLPVLIDLAGVTIDGLTQPDQTGGTASCDGYVPNHNLYIEIDGSLAPVPSAPIAHGIWIGSDNNIIKGLIINNFNGDGIRIEAGAPGFQANHADNNLVNCNIIGTDPSGSFGMGNGIASNQPQGLFFAGVTIKNLFVSELLPTNALFNIVEANLISENTFEGVQIIGPVQPGDVGFNQVLNNFIGTDLTGMSGLGNNRQGVNLSEGTHDNQIADNLISDNGWDGVGMQGFSNIGFSPPSIFTRNNTVANNFIGVDNNPGNFSPLGNGNNGISIGLYGTNTWGYADSNDILSNTIWYNLAAGISLWEDTAQASNTFPYHNTDHNLLSMNSIWQNGGLGIDIDADLVVTMNDPGDPDSLSNQQLNFPVLQSVSINGPNATITGTVGAKANNVEVYLTNPDPTGYGEGKTFLGTATPAAGSWSLNVGGGVITPTSVVTAIAQDAARNTSEFGMNISAPLALDLIEFKVSARPSYILLDWIHDTEDGVTGYHVQRGINPFDFDQIASVVSTERNLYSDQQYYEDHQVIAGVEYFYRIAIELENGSIDYSPIRSAQIARPDLVIFPNPVFGEKLTVQFGGAESGVLNLISNDGKVLKTFEVLNLSRVFMDLKDLPEGHYWLRYTNDQKTITERVIVL